MRLRFLSPDKQKHERAKLVGTTLFFIGGMLVYNGVETEELFFVGVMLLVWSGMSWLAYRNTPEKPLHIIQEVLCFLLFFGISVVCGVIAANLPNWVTYEGLSILINLMIIVLFLLLLFFRGGSSKKEPKA